MKIKFIDRGFKENIVLIPGWATDWRIFGNLYLNYNYLLPVEFDPFSFEKELMQELNKRLLSKISLFGWSLGGFLAAEFAVKNPERIEELSLLSIRQRFDHAVLKSIESKLKVNKEAYLRKFYFSFFCDSEEKMQVWFKRNLLNNYLEEMELNNLINGLSYLSEAKIAPGLLSGFKKIKIVHGSEDKIVPLNEVIAIKSQLAAAKFICLPQTGHVPFLAFGFLDSYHG